MIYIVRLFILLLFFMPSWVLASELILKSGEKLEGKIVEKTDKYIKFDTGIGIAMTYYADEIDTIDGQKLQSPTIPATNNTKSVQMNLSDTVIPDGPYKEYYPNGQLQTEGAYKNGKKDGIFKTYMQGTGILYIESVYKNDILVKNISYSGSTGQFMSEWYITPDGKRVQEFGGRGPDHPNAVYTCDEKTPACTGIEKKFYSSGGVYSEVSQLNGKSNGPSRYYDEGGRVESEGVYQNGKKQGPFKRYYLGKLRQEDNYSPEGKLDGVSKSYNENGKLIQESQYSEGKLVKVNFMSPDAGKFNLWCGTGTNFMDGTFEDELATFKKLQESLAQNKDITALENNKSKYDPVTYGYMKNMIEKMTAMAKQSIQGPSAGISSWEAQGNVRLIDDSGQAKIEMIASGSQTASLSQGGRFEEDLKFIVFDLNVEKSSPNGKLEVLLCSDRFSQDNCQYKTLQTFELNQLNSKEKIVVSLADNEVFTNSVKFWPLFGTVMFKLSGDQEVVRLKNIGVVY